MQFPKCSKVEQSAVSEEQEAKSRGNNADSNDRKPTFGLKSPRAPPAVPEMKQFEEDVTKMLDSIEFHNRTNL